MLLLLLPLPLSAASARTLPNIIFILADDLGYGDLGCYGQTKIRTPNLDRLAAQGMRLTTHYSGHNVCAPSRCVLMSGKHPGHAYIRENRGGVAGAPEGQEPVPPRELTLPLTLRKLGYRTGGFGKWGLGPVGSTGDPLHQGFHRFYGYNCQAIAHNAYPTHLWDDHQRVPLQNTAFSAHQKFPTHADPHNPENYQRYTGTEYAPDLIAQQAIQFVRDNHKNPFFLYYPTIVPHLALQVPADSLRQYEGTFPEEPYLGNRSYLPHRTPRAAYAAMITRMDQHIGRLLQTLEEHGLHHNTIVIFTSDNGPLYDQLGGTDTDFFQSAAAFRGRKGSYYEGGFRVPCIVRWPERIRPGSTSPRITGFEDWLPTLLELVGARKQTPSKIDGISFAPTLLGQKQRERAFLYRESPGYGGQQCLRMGRWKAIRTGLNSPQTRDSAPSLRLEQNLKLELYDLEQDPSETRNVAQNHPQIVHQMEREMARQHTPSTLWPITALDR